MLNDDTVKNSQLFGTLSSIKVFTFTHTTYIIIVNNTCIILNTINNINFKRTSLKEILLKDLSNSLKKYSIYINNIIYFLFLICFLDKEL